MTKHLTANVEGQSLDFTDEELSQLTDMTAVNKVYKLSTQKKSDATSAVNGKQLVVVEVEERKEAETAVLAIIALKGS